MKKSILLLYLKGVVMGIADLVPGVSGGTIALLTGIYNKLISSLAAIDSGFFIALIKLKITRLREKYNIVFFIVLGFGILSGIGGGAKIVHIVIEEFPPVLYGLFSGIICASAVGLIGRSHLIGIFLWSGIIFGLVINFLLDINIAFTPLNVFFAGALAICAMLLPGISGSFILLLIGIYEPLIDAVVNFKITYLAIFAGGAILMIFIFSKLIFLALKHYQKQALGFLMGLMLGSLPKLWPWQGETKQLILLSPQEYSNLTGKSSYIFESFAAFIIAILCIVLIKWGSSKTVVLTKEKYDNE